MWGVAAAVVSQNVFFGEEPLVVEQGLCLWKAHGLSSAKALLPLETLGSCYQSRWLLDTDQCADLPYNCFTFLSLLLFLLCFTVLDLPCNQNRPDKFPSSLESENGELSPLCTPSPRRQKVNRPRGAGVAFEALLACKGLMVLGNEPKLAAGACRSWVYSGFQQLCY